MTPIVVALPDTVMLDRLVPAPDEVSLTVWTPDDAAPDHRIDLLVLPYTSSPSALTKLVGLDIGLVQSQTLGFDGVAEVLPAGMRFANVVGVHEGPTGELAVALMLESQRGLDVMARAQPSGSWVREWYPGCSAARYSSSGSVGLGRRSLNGFVHSGWRSVVSPAPRARTRREASTRCPISLTCSPAPISS